MFKKIFVLFILINLFIPQISLAAPPTNYNKEVTSDVPLRGAIFAIDATGLYAHYQNEQIRISSDDHQTITLKFKLTSLDSRLKGFDGLNVGITHIADDGTISHYIDTLEADGQGFAYGTFEFSEVIISGLTGITTFNEVGLSGNHTKTFNEVNVSYIEFNITNHQSNADAYGNDLYIDFSPNKSMISGFNSDLPLQAYFNIPFGVAENGTNVRIYYSNGTEIPREIESYSNNNLSIFFKPDATDNTTNVTYRLWYGNMSAPKPTPNSTYGSQVVWDTNYVGVWHLNNDPAGSPVGLGVLLDSTSNTNDGDSYGTMTSEGLIDGDYGKGINFDGVEDYFRIPYSSELQTSTWGIIAQVLRTGDSGTHQNVLSRGHHLDINEYRNYQMYIAQTAWPISQVFESSGGVDEGVVAGGEITQDAIEFLEGKYDGSNSWVLNSGVQVGTAAETATPDTTTTDLMIGEYVRDAGAEYGWEFLGDMYEVRLSNITRSDKYSLTTYKNLNNPTATGVNAFYKSISDERTAVGSAPITTSVIGDTNTTNYTTDIPQTHTLTPTTNITEIVFNSSSQNWDYTAILYWTNDVILTETTDDGEYHANITATEPLNLDSGWINFTIDNSTLLNSDFSNFIQISTNDSNFNESESNLSLPDISIFTNATIGSYFYDLQYDYFNSPQNLSATPTTNSVLLNWSNVTNVDKYSIYELEEGIVWFDTQPVLDGIIDNIYLELSHQFHINSPNPVNNNDFDVLYMGRDAEFVYLSGTAIDNDGLSLDDYARLYIDFTKDGLSTDDLMYQIRENGAASCNGWSGIVWTPCGSSGVTGTTTGAGTNSIIYELRVPVSELPTNWVNGTNVRMLLEREDTFQNPNVFSYYPMGAKNS